MSGYFTEKAIVAWGSPLPDWIAALATACDQTSQARVATKIGRSGALVSGVLAKTYRGDMGAVEELVRGHLLSETVNCPALGVLPLHECRAWRAKADAFQNTNSLRVRMYRACRFCNRYKGSAQHEG